mgnify:CR=1 FL=1
MKRFFARNIDSRGRVFRGVGGVILVIVGMTLCGVNLPLSVVLIISGGFMLFEAVRGWCVMRACGIKTKL